MSQSLQHVHSADILESAFDSHEGDYDLYLVTYACGHNDTVTGRCKCTERKALLESIRLKAEAYRAA